MNRRLLLSLLVVGAVLLLAAGILYVTLSPAGVASPFATPTPTPTPLPRLEITPPPSLAELAEQYPDLASILTDPELDSVYKQFLLAYQEGGEEAAKELARQRGLLTPDGDIRVNLVLDTEDHAPLVDQLEVVGVVVVSAYRDRVNVSVPMELVEAQLETEDPGAIFIQLTELEHVIAVRLPEQAVPDGSAIEGEGVRVIGADAWHRAGFTGAGIRIGILDGGGFAGYQSLLGVELPEQVTVEEFGWTEGVRGLWSGRYDVHGTACAEVIHEIAPDAELFFAWYDKTDAAFGEATDWLKAQGVTIISHSGGRSIGPRDGSEWNARRVDELAEQGILWVNAAGNEGSAHYRGTFTDQDGDGLHEFAPDEEIMPVSNWGHCLVCLMWDDWTEVTQDYELLLYGPTVLSDPGTAPLATSEDPQSGSPGQWPAEWIELTETGGETVYVAVKAYAADRPVTLDIFVFPADLEDRYQEPAYSIRAPSDAVGSLTAGAANRWDDSLAHYSSQGPTTDGRLKPEISAPIAVTGASYGDSVVYNEYSGFAGTSAACPHVAGAAALVWQAYPEFSRQEVIDYLLTHAVDRGAPGPDTGHGYGRLQLPPPPSGEAASPVPPSPTPSPAQPEPTVGPTATPVPPPPTVPLPIPTAVPYVTPAPPPSRGTGAGVLTAAGLILLTGGVGCLGALLLLAGGIGLLVLGRRSRAKSPPRSRRARRRPPPARRRAPTEPVRCSVCGAAVEPGARFCNACGRPVTPGAQAEHCRQCGAALRPGARFCRHCGRLVE